MSSLQQIAKSEGFYGDDEPSKSTATNLDSLAAEVSASRRNLMQSSGRSSFRGRYPARGRGRGRGRGTYVPVCKFYRQGICTRGYNCQFRHTPEGGKEGSSYSNPKGCAPTTLVIGTTKTESNYDDFEIPTTAAVDTPVASESPYKRRPYCPVSAAVIMRAKTLQDAEPCEWKGVAGPFYSIDVECVATGTGHSTAHRLPGRVAMVDSEGETLVDEIINLEGKDVVSYLTPLTGLTKEMCSSERKTFDEVVDMVKAALPKDGVLVGQCIQHDIDWLGLKEGVDFRESIEISHLFRQRIPKNLKKTVGSINDGSLSFAGIEGEESNSLEQVSSSKDAGDDSSSTSSIKSVPPENSGSDEIPTKYRVFSLRHCCLILLGEDIQSSTHDPAIDAKYSIILFNKYKDSNIMMLRAVRDSLHRSPHTLSFSQQNPVIDGVCLGKEGYRYKHAGRFILLWWRSLFGGYLIPKLMRTT